MPSITVKDQMLKLVWCAIDNDGLNGKDTNEIAALTNLSIRTVRGVLNANKTMFVRHEHRGGGFGWKIIGGGTQTPLGPKMVEFINNVAATNKDMEHALHYFKYLQEDQPVKFNAIKELLQSKIA